MIGSSARKSQIDRDEIVRSVVEGNKGLVQEMGVGRKLEE